MNNQHVFDLLSAYALDCLDADDKSLVTEHLAACDVCRRELKSYQGVMDELPLAIAESEPSSALRERILQGARQAKPPAAAASAGPSGRGWLARLSAMPSWTALSLVLILALGASNLLLWGRLGTLERRTEDQLMTVLLQGTQSAPYGTGLLVISLDGSHGTLVVDQLPVLDEAQQYQLWLTRDGQRISGGVFSVDEKGYKSMYVKSPELLISYTSFGVTVEPAGGSPGPTGEKVLDGDL